MQLMIKHDVENNIFTSEIAISSYGSATLEPEVEKEMLNDFAVKLAYRNLVFEKNVKLVNGMVVVTDEEPGEGVIKVEIPALPSREYRIGDGMLITYSVDASKISNLMLDESVLSTKELVAKAYCEVFDVVVTEGIEDLLAKLNTVNESVSDFTDVKYVNI